MHHRWSVALSWAAVTASVVVTAQTIPAEVIERSRRDGAREAPPLIEVLHLEPGMSVADVGAGVGGWTLAMATLVGAEGTVYATDVGAPQLAILRDVVAREAVSNVTIIEGGPASTNLPDDCCHALFMRNVYHHLTQPEAVIDSVFAALKPGGRLAIIDFVARPGSALPPGVRKNRGGNGIAAEIVVDELENSAFTYIGTRSPWPPDSQPPSYYLVLFEKPAQ